MEDRAVLAAPAVLAICVMVSGSLLGSFRFLLPRSSTQPVTGSAQQEHYSKLLYELVYSSI